MGGMDGNGLFEGFPKKNHKLLNVGQSGDTFDFRFHTSTIVEQLSADAMQQWIIDNGRTDQWGQISCRVKMIPYANLADTSELVIHWNFLLLEKDCAEANTAP